MAPTQVTVRDATSDDAEAVARIYNHYIDTSTVTFDTEPKTCEERVVWIASHGPSHPAVVAEIDGEVVGFGALSAWATRPAWSHTVEVSSYVAEERRRQGVGAALMDALVARAITAGHHVLIGQIVSENEASILLAERMGFEHVGTLHEVGYKFGRWLDVVYMERIL